MNQENLFPVASPPPEPQETQVEKDLYDGLLARERFRRLKIENDKAAKKLIYAEEADTVVRAIQSIVVHALATDVDSLPDRLTGRSPGEIREILVERYDAVVRQTDVALSGLAGSEEQ